MGQSQGEGGRVPVRGVSGEEQRNIGRGHQLQASEPRSVSERGQDPGQEGWLQGEKGDEEWRQGGAPRAQRLEVWRTGAGVGDVSRDDLRDSQTLERQECK